MTQEVKRPELQIGNAIKIRLEAWTNVGPLELASFVAKICYQSELPQMGQMIDVENALFKTGHHTTLQHFFMTFVVDGIGIGDVTFGLHLPHVFYNTDQRSGRFCGKMFENPDFHAIARAIFAFWPELKKQSQNMTQVMDYIKQGVGIYHQNIATASGLTATLIQQERPKASQQYVEQNGPKIAQEQMRMFIPVIFPTGLAYTINLSTLAAMYRTAWTPVQQQVVGGIVKLALRQFPELKPLFDKKDVAGDFDSLELPKLSSLGVKYSPSARVIRIVGADNFIVPTSEDMHPVDRLHFLPRYMNNTWGEIQTEVEISTATMGQDQRHRTVRRSRPSFTGNFYLPPAVRKLGLKNQGLELMKQWVRVSRNLPPTLAQALAPYGAMVTYKKAASFNAFLHEQAKRLCWCAQEEISEVGRKTRRGVIGKLSLKHPLVKSLEPTCFITGRCGEGGRYCGRDISLRKKGEAYFPKRLV